MEIVRIFDDDSILTVQFDGHETDAFTQIFIDWTNIEFLEDFFTKNEADLKHEFWGGISLEDAVITTRNEAIEFYDYIKSIADKTVNHRISLFRKLFKPLTKVLLQNRAFEMKKAYGLRTKTWLRIYALKIDDDMFIITGGTLKLTDSMYKREHTREELRKLERCTDYLKENSIIDKDGMLDYLEL